MKKLLCLLLAACLLVTLSVPALAASKKEEEELLEVTLATYSNHLGRKSLNGLYRDNTLYMHPKVLASLMNCPVEVNQDSAVFTLLSGYLRMTVVADDPDIPTVVYNGELYISAPHLLRKAGAIVGFGTDETAQIHMMVSMPYTVLDLLGQYQNANGYRFSWSEAKGKLVDPEKLVYLAALDTVLLGYDSNVMGYLIPGRGENVAEDIYTDILLELLRSEGTDLYSGEDPQVQLFSESSDLLDLSSGWLQEVMDWIEDDTFSKTFHNTMGKMLDGSGLVVSAAGEYMQALEISRQFANLTDTQKKLLDKTLNRVSVLDPARDELPELFSAAEKASDYMNDQYDAQEEAAWKGVSKLMDDALDSWLSVSNPISFAWDSMTTIAKLDPLVGQLLNAEQDITFAAETDNIRVLAQQMIDQSISRLDANDAYVGRRNGVALYEQVRYEIILSLKASLTARLLLIDSGFLTEESASAMKSKAAATARLLNKAQNAQPIPVGLDPVVKEDLRWIAKLAGSGRYGLAVDTGTCSYYWKLPDGGYDTTGILSSFSQTADATLVRRDESGAETELFTGEKVGVFAVTNSHILTTENGLICSRDLKGENLQTWGEGTLQAVSSNGQFAVFQKDSTVTVLDIRSETKYTVTSGGNFERLYNDVVYYTVDEADYDAAAAGQLSLWAVNVDGSNAHLVMRTAPDMYDWGMSATMVAHMHFDDSGVYFSYGAVGGSGMMYQQGKIAYASFDGTETRVVAGQDQLVSADFVVNGDGTVSCTMDDYYPLFDWHRAYLMENGTVYWVDPVSGRRTVAATESDYARSDLQYEQVLLDYVQQGERYMYFALEYVRENPDASIGWRTGYDRVATVLYRKDLETGQLTELNIIR